jgi:transketolase
MALYPILEARGWIEQRELSNYFQDGSQLPGLYEASIPGCEANSGSLGQGVGVAAGLALAIELRGSTQKVFCVVGDGELNEGSAFEALSFIGQKKFLHFALVVDLNGLQAMGTTEEVISQDGLDQILRGLGFHVLSVNGHDEGALSEIFRRFVDGEFLGPVAVLARTVKGKGVDFMENHHKWHGVAPDDSQLEKALAQLEETLGDY